MTDKPHIIFDNGSGFTKAGFAGQYTIITVLLCIIGRLKNKGITVGSESKDYYIETQADEKSGILTLTYPIVHGIVNDWDDMEKLWEHTFTSELRVKHDKHNVILSQATLNPKVNREKIASIMFNKFRVSGFYIVMQVVLSLYSAERFTGCVCDSGDGIKHLVPIYDGYSLPHSIKRMDLAGRDLTTYMAKILQDSGYTYTTLSNLEIVKNIKEKLCYITLDYKDEMSKFQNRQVKEAEYEMSNGQVIKDGNQRFRCPEVLFDHSIIIREFGEIDIQTKNSIMASYVDIRKDLYINVALSGGATLCIGLPERLTNVLKNLANPNMASKIKIVVTSE